MSTTELTLNQLAEVATRELSQQVKPVGFDENREVAFRGGNVAGNARKELEAEIGHTVISEKDATQINTVVTNLIEDVSKSTEEK